MTRKQTKNRGWYSRELSPRTDENKRGGKAEGTPFPNQRRGKGGIYVGGGVPPPRKHAKHRKKTRKKQGARGTGEKKHSRQVGQLE